MHSCTIIDSVEPMDSSCLQTTAFLPQSNVFDSIDLIHEFFFQFNSSLAQHFTSNANSTPIHATEFITSLMLSFRNAIRHPKRSAKQNPQDLQHHGHDSSAHVVHQSQVIMNA